MTETLKELDNRNVHVMEARECSSRFHILAQRISILSDAMETIDEGVRHDDPGVVLEALCDVIGEANREIMELLEKRHEIEKDILRSP